MSGTATTTAVQTELRHPRIEDGAEMWRIARDSVRLDLNPPYAYLLWARDFGLTSMVADVGGEVGGFVSGFRRSEEPGTLMIWQVAVDEAHRGRGLAGQLLDELVRRTAADTLETTVTADNLASQRLFEGLARRHGAQHSITELFAEDHFPAGQDWMAELLHRITPLRRAPHTDHRPGSTARGQEIS